MQDVVAILLVLACVGYVGYQLVGTIRSGQGKVGKCCSRGCDMGETKVTTSPNAPTAPKEQFFPSDLLRRKKA